MIFKFTPHVLYISASVTLLPVESKYILWKKMKYIFQP